MAVRKAKNGLDNNYGDRDGYYFTGLLIVMFSPETFCGYHRLITSEKRQKCRCLETVASLIVVSTRHHEDIRIIERLNIADTRVQCGERS